MRPQIKILLMIPVLSVLLLIFSCNKQDTSPRVGAGVGNILPEFALKNADGDTVRLSDFNGKIVLIEMWASWCGYCNTEAPGLNELYADYKAKNFEIVGISIDSSPSAWKNKVKDHEIIFTQVNDLRGFDAPVVEAYHVSSIPKMILLNEDGVVVLITTKAIDVRAHLQQRLQ